jgi:tRNA pseudouridine38-40 synthase
LPTFKLTLAYDGTGLVGWQRQAAGVSVQELVEEACGELDGRAVTVVAAGRTDAGVHALGQVATVSLVRVMAPRSLVAAINARLPPAVRVLQAAEVAPDFHPRFHARRKTYRYRIWNAGIVSPFERLYSWHVPAELDIASMRAAARAIEGTHDFGAFRAAGSDSSGSVRSVFVSDVQAGADALVVYEISGDGFLRHMVRTIVGTLVEVGRGRRSRQSMAEILASRDRGRAGPTAPPEGLFLTRVEYDEPAPPAAAT